MVRGRSPREKNHIILHKSIVSPLEIAIFSNFSDTLNDHGPRILMNYFQICHVYFFFRLQKLFFSSKKKVPLRKKKYPYVDHWLKGFPQDKFSTHRSTSTEVKFTENAVQLN